MILNKRWAWTLGALALCVVPVGTAVAAEWDSYATFTFQNRAVDLPDGRTIMTFTNNGAYQNIWSDRTTVGTLACTGMVERGSDGVELDGYCEHVDPDGDKYYQRSQRSKSAQAGGAGHETGLGGTGKHAGREWTCDYWVTYVSASWGVVRAKCSGDPPKS